MYHDKKMLNNCISIMRSLLYILYRVYIPWMLNRLQDLVLTDSSYQVIKTVYPRVGKNLF